MSLERVLNFAAGQGSSLIPRGLLPDGFECWPAEDQELRMSRIARYAGRLVNDGVALAGVQNLERWTGGKGKEGVRHVATPGGARLYKAPIGTPITAKMRFEAQQAWGKGHESRQFGREGGEVGKQANQVNKAAAAAGIMPGLGPPEAGGPGAGPQGAAAGPGTVEAGAAVTKKPAAAAARSSRGAGTAPSPGKAAGGHPKAIGGHQVQKTYSHPQSTRVIHDLGHGLHAEQEPGQPAGGVMRSATGIDEGAFRKKGWLPQAPQAERKAAAAGARTGAATGAKAGLQGAGARANDVLSGGAAARTAAEGAAKTAIAKSGMIDDKRYQELQNKVAQLEERLAHTHADVVQNRFAAKQAGRAAEEAGGELHESHRVSLAVNLLEIAGELVVAALAGGLIGPAAFILAAPIVLRTAAPLLEYHGAKYEAARKVLSHPVATIKAPAAKVAKPTRKGIPKNKPLSAELTMALAAAASPESGGLQGRAAAVLKAALAYHGVPAETAKEFADRAAATGYKNATAGLVKNHARNNGVKLSR